MVTTIQLRRDTAARWAENNPILADGEPGVAEDVGEIRVGDGATRWLDLPSYRRGLLDGVRPLGPTAMTRPGRMTKSFGKTTGMFNGIAPGGVLEDQGLMPRLLPLMAPGRLHGTRIWFDRDVTITAMLISVGDIYTPPLSNLKPGVDPNDLDPWVIRMGIYPLDEDQMAHPEPIFDAGVVDPSTRGVKKINFPPFTLNAGGYLLVSVLQGPILEFDIGEEGSTEEAAVELAVSYETYGVSVASLSGDDLTGYGSGDNQPFVDRFGIYSAGTGPYDYPEGPLTTFRKNIQGAALGARPLVAVQIGPTP